MFSEEGKSDLSLPTTPFPLGALLVDSSRLFRTLFSLECWFFMDKSMDKLPSKCPKN